MKGSPGSFLVGSPRRCGSAPRRRGSASVVQRPRGTGTRSDVRNSARARVMGGGGGAVGWFWGGGGGAVGWFWGGGGEVGWFCGGRGGRLDGFAGVAGLGVDGFFFKKGSC